MHFCDPGQPGVWIAQGHYFHDPGNALYSVVLDLLIAGPSTAAWSQETKGGFIEGVLGLQFAIFCGYDTTLSWHPITRRNITYIAAILHFVTKTVLAMYKKNEDRGVAEAAIERAVDASIR